MKVPYSHEELYALGPQKVYENEYLNEISFPLGGIGTGSIGLSGRGELIDFEIYNRPNLGSRFPKTFPLIRVKLPNSEPICRVLEGSISRPYTPHDGGWFHSKAEGFPHMDSCVFRGEYPFAWLDFQCSKLPLEITLEAYNPFIPSDAEASGIPCAILKYCVKNSGSTPADVSILWSMLNISGFGSEESQKYRNKWSYQSPGQFFNMAVKENDLQGIMFGNNNYADDSPLFGNLALISPDKEITLTTSWKAGPWFSPHYHIWNYFKEHGTLEPFQGGGVGGPDAGAIAIQKTIKPGATETFTFYFTWFHPNFEKYWQLQKASQNKKPQWRNYYATQYEDALDVALKLHQNERNYHELTKRFHDALFSSTLPPYILESIACNMAILKTTTCLRLEDGTFYGWEGCHPSEGCCEGTCTHVWGYQQALPFLFPSLERSMHNANYKYNFLFPDLGALEFRIKLPLGSPPHGFGRPCADGQFGGIMHVYREWKISGDNAWLKEIWFGVKMALEFAWEDWDEEKTGVLRNFQHNTYDIDFYGPNPMLTCYYLGALKAGAEMAKAMGDLKSAEDYIAIHNRGCKWVEENLFNGEYFIQEKYDSVVAPLYQVNAGCLIDQLVGQQIARIAGLDNILSQDKIKSTLRSIFKYNFKTTMREHENGARLYAVNDEAATIICTWPHGNRPEIPFPYADEVMYGFEYQFGIHCIIENMLDEGLTVIKAIRDRFDGYGRNPWDEFECGHHYARSMASHGALIALSGFTFDKGAGHLGFSPKIYRDSFKTFWSLDNVWGTYSQSPRKAEIVILYGSFTLKTLLLPHLSNVQKIKIATKSGQILVTIDKSGLISLPTPQILNIDEKIGIESVDS
jgi:uncharacterized protein (DUF608 family)